MSNEGQTTAPSLGMSLTDYERQEIQTGLQKINQLKIVHSDVSRKLVRLGAEKVKAETQIDEQEKALQDRVNGMAKIRGADLDKPNNGWFLNFDTMTFSAPEEK